MMKVCIDKVAGVGLGTHSKARGRQKGKGVAMALCVLPLSQDAGQPIKNSAS